MKYAAININFDSLGEAYGFPSDYADPSFHKISERFFNISEKRNFKYSIYVIGKDLENRANRAKVKEWAQSGHEIGNHSWSHPLNLGALRESQVYEEVKKAHDVIAETIEREPQGFIAPGWSASTKLRRVLMNLGYYYDTSSFPSLLMYPSLLKMLLNHIGDKRFYSILNRKDLHYPLFANRKAHVDKWNSKTIVSLPLPTTKWRIACWHTTAFLFGWKTHKRLLKACLAETDYFYYLIHPADLIGQDDLDPTKRCCLERMDYALEYKLDLLELAIEEIVNSGRKLITMQELAIQVEQNAPLNAN